MTDKTSNSQKPIKRREMLKKGALATGVAITAAAFLDGKWLKPVVKTGVLPVHAQASVVAVPALPAQWFNKRETEYIIFPHLICCNCVFPSSYTFDDIDENLSITVKWGIERVTIVYNFDDMLIREKNSENSLNGWVIIGLFPYEYYWVIKV